MHAFAQLHERSRRCRLTTLSSDVFVAQSAQLATEIVQQLPKASIAALIASLTMAQANPAAAAEFYQPPAQANTATQQVRTRTLPPPKAMLALFSRPHGHPALARGCMRRHCVNRAL